MGAFFSLYFLFTAPAGVNLWYHSLTTQLLVSGGTVLLISEKMRPTYYAAGAFLISLILIVLQTNSRLKYNVGSYDRSSNFIFLMFIGVGFIAFIFSFISIMEEKYKNENLYKRID